MRFTRQTDYALRVLMFLGLRPAGELSTIREIADRYGCDHTEFVVTAKMAEIRASRMASRHIALMSLQ